MRIKNQFYPFVCTMVTVIYFAFSLLLLSFLNDSLSVLGIYIFMPALFFILPNVFPRRSFAVILVVNGLMLDLKMDLLMVEMLVLLMDSLLDLVLEMH